MIRWAGRRGLRTGGKVLHREGKRAKTKTTIRIYMVALKGMQFKKSGAQLTQAPQGAD
jgi:hypothetical protein